MMAMEQKKKQQQRKRNRILQNCCLILVVAVVFAVQFSYRPIPQTTPLRGTKEEKKVAFPDMRDSSRNQQPPETEEASSAYYEDGNSTDGYYASSDENDKSDGKGETDDEYYASSEGELGEKDEEKEEVESEKNEENRKGETDDGEYYVSSEGELNEKKKEDEEDEDENEDGNIDEDYNHNDEKQDGKKDEQEDVNKARWTKLPSAVLKRHYDVCVVGAGLSGAVIAERYASQRGKTVLVMEKRDHIGGNCYDYIDKETGIRVSKYGAHLFHTKYDRVWNYVQHFSAWTKYEHKVQGYVNGTHVPIPVNIETVNKLFGLDIKGSDEMDEWLAKEQVKYEEEPANSEEMAMSRVGERLYNLIFKPYTFKQWAKWPAELGPEVTARIPVRNNYDDRYFDDPHQALPTNGYTAIFEKMLASDNITVSISTDYFEERDSLNCDRIYFTGPIDAYYAHLGWDKLEYRSLDFEKKVFRDTEYFQPMSVVNHPSSDVDYTRIVEYKHMLNQSSPHTVVFYERSKDGGEPYYPVPNKKNKDLFAKYKKLTLKEPNVTFVGRLANYKYFNMDQSIKNALELFDKDNNIKHKTVKTVSAQSKVPAKDTKSSKTKLPSKKKTEAKPKKDALEAKTSSKTTKTEKKTSSKTKIPVSEKKSSSETKTKVPKLDSEAKTSSKAHESEKKTTSITSKEKKSNLKQNKEKATETRAIAKSKKEDKKGAMTSVGEVKQKTDSRLKEHETKVKREKEGLRKVTNSDARESMAVVSSKTKTNREAVLLKTVSREPELKKRAPPQPRDAVSQKKSSPKKKDAGLEKKTHESHVSQKQS